MSRYIDADALLESVKDDRDFYKDMYDNMQQPCEQDEREIVGASYTAYGKCYHRIRTAPTVDAVPVVRCGECKNWEEKPLINGNGTRFGTCPLMMGLFFKSDFYCADGKRKEKENE